MAKVSGRGIYYIINVREPVVIDMLSGDSTDGSRIGAWERTDPSGLNSYNQLWLVEPVEPVEKPGSVTKYTIRNIRSGTYMDLANTVPYTNGATLIGRARGGETQSWFIESEEDGTTRIRNSVTETYIDLNEGNGSCGAMISGWDWVGYGPSRANQLWMFEKVSLSSEDIRDKLRVNSSLGKELEIRRPGRLYIALPPDTIRSIHAQCGLNPSRVKKDLFDCDDFAFVFKAAVAQWGDQNLRADGFGILCGVLFAENVHGSHALNWTLSSSHADAIVLFIEPRDGSLVNCLPGDYKVHYGTF